MEREISDQLLDEVRQITAQYRSEVPGRRRTWPRSVRKRIAELGRAGLSWKQLSEATGIPVTTLYQWNSRRAKTVGFRQVPLVAASGSGTKSVTSTKSESKTSTVTMAADGVIRIEGLSVGEAAVLVRLLR